MKILYSYLSIIIILFIIVSNTGDNKINIIQDSISKKTEKLRLSNARVYNLADLIADDKDAIYVNIKSIDNLEVYDTQFSKIDTFEFNEYIPFVKYSISSIRTISTIYDYAFLGEGVESLVDGNFYYELLNNQYNEHYKLDYNIKSDLGFASKDILKIFSMSRVIYISNDGKVIVTMAILKNKDISKNSQWNCKLDIFKDRKLIYSFNTDIEDLYDFSVMEEMLFLENNILFKEYETDNVILTCINYSNGKIVKIRLDKFINNIEIKNNQDSIIFENIYENTYYIYSINEMKLKYVVNFKGIVHQYLNDELLVTVFDDNLKDRSILLINLKNTSIRYLGSDIFFPTISPDKKYLSYTTDNGIGVEYNKNNQEGFFIKNLETEETVFYSLDLGYVEYYREGYDYKIINWINRDSINRTMNFNIFEN